MLRTLIVDDEYVERQGLSFLIHEYELPLIVAQAENGEEALQYIQENDADILLTDIRMPFMNGLELSRHVRQLRPDIKIIIVSAYGEFEYARKAMSLGVTHYLLKPVNDSEFLDVMTSVIRHLGRSGSVSDEYGCGIKAIYDAVRCIQENYTAAISIEFIAERVYLSPDYLSALFKKHMGQGIMQYITGLRMKKAEKLLSHTNMKVCDIAQYVGFANTSYFCLVFKKHFNVNPVKYRESCTGYPAKEL